jgi:hypothetical protein
MIIYRPTPPFAPPSVGQEVLSAKCTERDGGRQRASRAGRRAGYLHRALRRGRRYLPVLPRLRPPCKGLPRPRVPCLSCLVSLLAPVPLAAQSRVRAATQESTLTLLSLSLYSCLLSLARACGTCELLLCCRSHSTLCAVRPPRSPLLWARCPLLWARPVLRSSTLNPQPSLLWARPVL